MTFLRDQRPGRQVRADLRRVEHDDRPGSRAARASRSRSVAGSASMPDDPACGNAVAGVDDRAESSRRMTRGLSIDVFAGRKPELAAPLAIASSRDPKAARRDEPVVALRVRRASSTRSAPSTLGVRSASGGRRDLGPSDARGVQPQPPAWEPGAVKTSDRDGEPRPKATTRAGPESAWFRCVGPHGRTESIATPQLASGLRLGRARPAPDSRPRCARRSRGYPNRKIHAISI